MKKHQRSEKIFSIFFLILFVGLANHFLCGDPPSPSLLRLESSGALGLRPRPAKPLAKHGRTGPDQHSFDSLFPKTWFTKATESCAQVWGAFEDLFARPNASPINRAIIIDAAIGRLVFAQFCIDLIVNAKDQSVSPNDAAYLVRIVDVVDERYKKLADSMEADRAYCVRRVIDALKKDLASL